MRFLACFLIGVFVLAAAIVRADDLPVVKKSEAEETEGADATASLPTIAHPSLLSITNFLDQNQPDSPVQTSLLAIDQRRNDLLPLSAFTFARSLQIDGRVNNLTLLASFNEIRLDPRVTQITPLSALKINEPVVASAPTVTEIELPELEPVPTEPTLFLRDIRTTWQSEFTYDDNLNAGANQQNGAWLALNDVSTAVTLQRRNNTYLASYGLVDRQYQSGEVSSNLDQKAYLNAVQELGTRNNLKLSWFWSRNHELRGNGLLEGVENTSFEDVAVTRTNFTVDHTLGDNDSRMRIKTSWSQIDQSYEDFGEITSVGNYQNTTISSELGIKTGPKTRWFLSGRWASIDYENDQLQDFNAFSTLDASSRDLQLGLERSIGRHSSVKLNWGRYLRDFEADRSDENTNIWNAEFAWNPRTYSRFAFSYGKQFLPSRGNGSFIEVTETQFKWSHQWSNRLRSQLNYSTYDDAFRDSIRRDTRENLGAIMTYAYSENWRLSMGYRAFQKQSNLDAFNFDRNMWFVRSVLRF